MTRWPCCNALRKSFEQDFILALNWFEPTQIWFYILWQGTVSIQTPTCFPVAKAHPKVQHFLPFGALSHSLFQWVSPGLTVKPGLWVDFEQKCYQVICPCICTNFWWISHIHLAFLTQGRSRDHIMLQCHRWSRGPSCHVSLGQNQCRKDPACSGCLVGVI